MLRNRLIKSLVLNVFIFISVLIFHHLGGGSFSISPVILPLFVLSILYFNSRPLNEFSGPGLAATLVLFQFLGHFIFHNNLAVSNRQMYLAHLIAVFFTYFLTRYFERVALSIDALIEVLLPKLKFEFLQLKIEIISLWIKSEKIDEKSNLLLVLKGRAPPATSRA